MRAFEEVYADRYPRTADFVVGYVGADVPVELITAAGALPVRLAGDPDGDLSAGDRYLGRGLDPVARSVLTRLLAGEYGRLDRLVVSRDCEASLRLFYAVRELRRIEPALGLPEAYLVDVLHLPHRTTTRYNAARLAQFRQRLRDWTGRAVSDADLALAISSHDAQRALLAELATVRRDGRITGTQWLAIVGAGTVLPVAAHLSLLRDVSTVDLPAHSGKRVFLTGSSHDTPHVYRALESAGYLIVGEDHDWGDLWYRRRVEGSTLLALAERYQYNGPTAQRSTVDERRALIAEGMRHAELLVGYARRGDEAPPWDFAGHDGRFFERQDYGRVAL
jgi:benzoyl-CoA reductase/2-hydroxyglutaryl-CoA dehydratase subunit BcrC/BadD/HgdB